MIDQLALIPLNEWSNLTSPNTLGEGLAVLIAFLFGIIPYGGMRLKSPAVFIAWAMTILVFVMTILTSLPFLWFWLMIVMDVFVVAMASVVFYMYN